MIPYARQAVDDSDIAAVSAVLRGDFLTQGPAVGVFEAALRGATGAPHVTAVNSGTAALHVGMLASGIGPGDLVLVPAVTFVASANAALYCGAEVAFIDVDPDTALVDPEAVDRFLRTYRGSARPRALVAVHYAGLPCDMGRLLDIARRHSIEVIEDACHALGATWTDAAGEVVSVGACRSTAFTALSFHPVKHITTAEGGAIATTRADLAARAEMLRSHGITKDPSRMESHEGPWWYEQHQLGYNYRLPDVLAALGTSQLRKHVPWLERRRALAARYRAAFATSDKVELQTEIPGREHAYHLFPILVDRRPRVFDGLIKRGIRPQVHYIPVHRQPFFRRRCGDLSLPGAESWYRREISIPMYGTLSDDEADAVIAAVLESVSV